MIRGAWGAVPSLLPPPQSSPARGEEEGWPTNACSVNLYDDVTNDDRHNNTFVRRNAVNG